MIGWLKQTDDAQETLRHQLAAECFSSLEEVEDWQTSSAKAVLFPEDYFSSSTQKMSYLNQNMTYLGFSDGVLKQNSKWVPECSYLDIFQRRLAAHAKYIDTSKGVMVAGDYEPSRAALLALYKIGFRDFYVIEKADGNHWLYRVRSHLFGLEIKDVNIRELVNLSGETSVLVHGVAETEKVSAEWELSYLNFMNRPGLIIDFLNESFLKSVVEETHDKDLYLLGRKEIEKDSLDWWKNKTEA